MPKIIFKHHLNTQNLGDRVCSPYDYFPVLSGGARRMDLEEATPPSDVVIYGGGKIMGGLARRMGVNDYLARTRIAWGVSTIQSSRFAPHYWMAYQLMSLIGTRDWGDDRFDWSPCVTCLSPEFDRPAVVQHEVVAYVHHWRIKDREISIPDDVPVMENIESDFASVVRFLASGEVVMSNSYHGVYWALLLGKKVICVPYSKKFYNYRFSPGYASGTSWYRDLGRARGHAETLDSCRAGAKAFAAKVIARLA